MKTILFVLLAASLVGNIYLAFGTHPNSAPGSTATAIESVAGASSSASGKSSSFASAGDASGSTAAYVTGQAPWPVAPSEQDMQRLVAKYRSLGYPPSVIRAIVNQLLSEHFAARRLDTGQPFWKAQARDADNMASKIALDNERRTLFENLLGPDARPSAMMDQVTRENRYGALPDDKIDAISKIERDYSELTAETYAQRKGNTNTSMKVFMESRELIESEKMADIAAVLTPEELAQYEQRRSHSALILINNLRNIDVSGTEYTRLFQAQKAYDTTNPQPTTMDAALFAQRQLAQLGLNEQVRTVLADDRFYSYLESSDRNYATTAETLAGITQVTPPVAYQVYQMQVDLQTKLAQLSQSSRSGQRASPEQMADMRIIVEDYNSRLEAAIGPVAADAYRKQGNGRIFSSFRTPTPPAK